MTQPRKWPSNALWARDDTAIALVLIVRELEPLLNESVTRDELMRRIGKSVSLASQGIINLQGVGAKIKPSGGE